MLHQAYGAERARTNESHMPQTLQCHRRVRELDALCQGLSHLFGDNAPELVAVHRPQVGSLARHLHGGLPRLVVEQDGTLAKTRALTELANARTVNGNLDLALSDDEECLTSLALLEHSCPLLVLFEGQRADQLRELVVGHFSKDRHLSRKEHLSHVVDHLIVVVGVWSACILQGLGHGPPAQQRDPATIAAGHQCAERLPAALCFREIPELRQGVVLREVTTLERDRARALAADNNAVEHDQ
mmetsp:Transcript_85879/g.247867  ORF Transcript_85879/g.247867 Transcript_85879/m.247867 type:complete len:243 (-) Transcript_85879:1352-2080(-)